MEEIKRIWAPYVKSQELWKRLDSLYYPTVPWDPSIQRACMAIVLHPQQLQQYSVGTSHANKDAERSPSTQCWLVVKETLLLYQEKEQVSAKLLLCPHCQPHPRMLIRADSCISLRWSAHKGEHTWTSSPSYTAPDGSKAFLGLLQVSA